MAGEKRNKQQNNDINQYIYKIVELKRPKVFVLEAAYRKKLQESLDVLSKQGYNIQICFADSEVITGKPLVEKRFYLIGIRQDVVSTEIVLIESEKRMSFRDVMQQDTKCFEKYALRKCSNEIKILDPDTGRVTCNFF